VTSLDVRAISGNEPKVAPFPAARHEFRVHIAEAAFDRAVARGDEDTTREIGGVLVGELLRDDAGPYVRVDATIDALHAEEKGAELTFTHATWEHIHKEMDSKHAKKKIVGWYHTHPGFGIFLSDRDQFIQSSFFNLPFQIALVYDPKSKEHGVFIWRDNEPWRCRRYWVGSREHTWDGPRVAQPKDLKEAAAKVAEPRSVRPGAAKDKEQKDAKSPDKGAEPRGGGGVDWWSLVTLVLVVAVVAMLGGRWLGSRGSAAALQQMEAEIDRLRAEGGRASASTLDAQLVAILKSTVGNEGVKRPAEQIVAELDESAKALAEAPGPDDPELQDGLAKLKSARDRAARLRDDRGDAYAALQQLEDAARRGQPSPAEIARDVAIQRSALGALYAELASDAARAGDEKRSRRLLAAAASVDPANRERYEQQAKPLGGAPR
jgi:proteasome lid subunit RPN8/RPN11